MIKNCSFSILIYGVFFLLPFQIIGQQLITLNGNTDNFLKDHPNYAKLHIDLDEQLSKKKLSVIPKEKPKRKKKYYKDQDNNYFLPEGDYFVSIRLDSCIAIGYSKEVNLKSQTSSIFYLRTNDLQKEINPQLPLIDQIFLNDTLIWLHRSMSNWHLEFDTILIHRLNDDLILDWRYKIRYFNSSTKFETKQKRIILNDELKNTFIKVEKIFIYEDVNHISMEDCSNCKGTNHEFEMDIGNIKKIYIEPTCDSNYWVKLKDKIFEK